MPKDVSNNHHGYKPLQNYDSRGALTQMAETQEQRRQLQFQGARSGFEQNFGENMDHLKLEINKLGRVENPSEVAEL